MTASLKNILVGIARERHGRILPIGGKFRHDERSFTTFYFRGEQCVFFWFEDTNRSTHIVMYSLDRKTLVN